MSTVYNMDAPGAIAVVGGGGEKGAGLWGGGVAGDARPIGR